MKRRESRLRLFDSNKFLKVFAVVLAVFLYIIVAMVTNDTIDYTIRNVPINLDLHSASLTNLGLNVIEGAEYMVDITINGPRTLVPQYEKDSPELATTVRLNNITEPGTHTVSVIPAVDTSDLPFKIVSYSPRSIQVRLDRLKTQSFSITPVVNGISIPPGYVLENQTVTPQRVSVTGPEAEVDKIVGAEIAFELTEALDHTIAPELDIVLRDAEGQAINHLEKHLTMDVEKAQLVLTVLKETGLPLEVKFLNMPRNFPEEELRSYLRMSTDYAMVAGPENVIGRLTEIMLGEIDLKELTPLSATFTFPLELPTQIVSLENLSNVAVNFETEEWDSVRFNVREIQLLNQPANYDVELRSTRIDGVQFVGKREILETMTADDIVAEVDLADREITPGQSNFPVKISAPSKGMVWAVGDYGVVIQVSEKE